jgi:hypothetical protein
MDLYRCSTTGRTQPLVFTVKAEEVRAEEDTGRAGEGSDPKEVI